MYVAGWTFHVLNNAFANHWGFQSVKTRPAWRARQQEANNKKFDEFAKELNARYGRDPYQMMSKLKKLNLKNIKHFILDECDKMLEQLGELISLFQRLF